MSVPARPTPALAPPAGQISNFSNPESLFQWDILTLCLCLVSTTVVFALRTYVRLSIKRSWILEDYACSISWVLEVFFLGFLTRLMSHLGGEHQWDLTKPQARYVLEWTNIVNCFYSPTILFVKVGILLLYRRIFVIYKYSLMDWSTQFLIFMVLGFEIAGMFIKIWECVPREKVWDKDIDGHCVNFAAFMISSGVFNTATDVIILFLPIKAVWGLQMTTKAKLGIISIFTIGLTAPIFSLVGMIVRIKIAPSTDVTYNSPKIHLFAAAEIASGLLCLCLPTLAALKPSHRNHIKRPSLSILNGERNSRRTAAGKVIIGSGKYGLKDTMTSGVKKSMDEQDLFDLELREGQRSAEEGIVTVIDGGKGDEGMEADEELRRKGGTCYPVGGGGDGSGEEIGRHNGEETIMRTVKIEQMQTYV